MPSEVTYILKIRTSDSAQVGQILNVAAAVIQDGLWSLTMVQADDDPYIPYVDTFLAVLEGRMGHLGDIGVMSDQISVWVLYQYEQQCNMEFSPGDLERLGRHGITLCVSCWHDGAVINLGGGATIPANQIYASK